MPSPTVWALATTLMLSVVRAQTSTTPADIRAEAKVDITFVSSPTSSSVWMDGKKLGKTPLRTKLPAGSTTLVFRPEVLGYAAQTRSFVWKPGETHRIVVELPMTFGQIRLDSPRPWQSVTFDGHSLPIQLRSWTRVQAGRHTVVGIDGRYAAKTIMNVPV